MENVLFSGSDLLRLIDLPHIQDFRIKNFKDQLVEARNWLVGVGLYNSYVSIDKMLYVAKLRGIPDKVLYTYLIPYSKLLEVTCDLNFYGVSFSPFQENKSNISNETGV